MRGKRPILAFAVGVTSVCSLFGRPAAAVELGWYVENRFRFYTSADDFLRHEQAFRNVCKLHPDVCSSAIPHGPILEMERWLNQRAYDGRATPARQQGWASRSSGVDDTCYDRISSQFREPCDRRDATDPANRTQSFIVPKTHRVRVGPSEGSVGTVCSFRWAPAREVDKPDSWHPVGNGTYPCDLDRGSWPGIDVPYENDAGGAVVEWKIGAEGPKREAVKVRDLLILGLGDSFASGEGNPDRPITPSGTFFTNYDNAVGRPTRNLQGSVNWYSRPDQNENFSEARAFWLERQCHRSQYSHQFRTALQLAVESERIAVSFVPLGCSGGMIDEGLLGSQSQREGSRRVRPQLDVVIDLICARTWDLKSAKTWRIDYINPPRANASTVRWTTCRTLKRKVDLVLLAIGGNDIGFSGIAGSTFIDRKTYTSFAIRLARPESRVSTELATAYLGVLDDRMVFVREALTQASKNIVALVDDPKRIVHVGYFVPDLDRTGQPCGEKQETRRPGVDVANSVSYNGTMMAEVGRFLRKKLFPSMRCMTSWSEECAGIVPPGGKKQALGQGTGFSFVDGFQPGTAKHGICALPTADTDASRREVFESRIPLNLEGRAPPQFSWSFEAGVPAWDPSEFWPYDTRLRWVVTPNDAFLRAHTHNRSWQICDRFQPLYAATYSGAFHPNAQGHAYIADFVYCEVRRVLREELGPTPARCDHLPARSELD